MLTGQCVCGEHQTACDKKEVEGGWLGTVHNQVCEGTYTVTCVHAGQRKVEVEKGFVFVFVCVGGEGGTWEPSNEYGSGRHQRRTGKDEQREMESSRARIKK